MRRAIKALSILLAVAMPLLAHLQLLGVFDRARFSSLLEAFEGEEAYISESAAAGIDPGEFAERLRAISGEFGSSIMRVAVDYSGGDAEVVVYAAVADAREFLEGVPLSAEFPPPLPESMSTQGPRPAIADFAGNDALSVRPLEEAFGLLPVSGAYRAKGGDARAAARAILAEAGPAEGSGRAFSYGKGAPGFAALFGSAALASVLLCVYLVLGSSRSVAVMKLHGHSSARAVWRASVRDAALAQLCGALLAAAAAARVANAGAAFALSELALQTVLCCAAAAAQTAAAAAVVRASASDALKKKRAEGGFLVASLCLKAIAGAVVVSRMAFSMNAYLEAKSLEKEALAWEAADGYAVFAPVSVGRDEEDFRNGSRSSEKAFFALYKELNRAGAIVCESAAALRSQRRGEPAGFKAPATVNPNYLAAFPVLGADGKAVAVAEGETGWILLAPETMRSESDEILSYWRGFRENRLLMDASYYGAGPGEGYQGPVPQDVRIVWTAAGQRAFAFNADAGLEGSLEDPVMAVLTEGNATISDTALSRGGIDGALKIKADGGSAETLARLKPALERHGFDDNFTSLATVSEWHAQRARESLSSMRRNALEMCAAALAMALLSWQSLAIHFDRDARAIAVGRLFGHGALRAHRRMIFALACAACAQCAAAALAWPEAGPAALWAAASAAASLDAALAAAFIARSRKAPVQKTIKSA